MNKEPSFTPTNWDKQPDKIVENLINSFFSHYSDKIPNEPNAMRVIHHTYVCGLMAATDCYNEIIKKYPPGSIRDGLISEFTKQVETKFNGLT